jgi:general secretion pathway protein H
VARKALDAAQHNTSIPSGGRGASVSQSGSTLLEVLLAVTIVAAGSAVVVANIPKPEPTLAREAQAFAARLSAAADEAVLSGLIVGVDVDEAGYGFRRRDAGAWRAIADAPALAPRVWASEVTVTVVREGVRFDRERLVDLGLDAPSRALGESEPPAPVGRFDPTGSATALAVDLASPEGSWRIEVGADGAVSLSAAEADARGGR